MIPLNNPHRAAPVVDPGSMAMLEPGAEYRPQVQDASLENFATTGVRRSPSKKLQKQDRPLAIIGGGIVGLLLATWFVSWQMDSAPVAAVTTDAADEGKPVGASASKTVPARHADSVPFQLQRELPPDISLEELAARRREEQRQKRKADAFQAPSIDQSEAENVAIDDFPALPDFPDFPPPPEADQEVDPAAGGDAEPGGEAEPSRAAAAPQAQPRQPARMDNSGVVLAPPPPLKPVSSLRFAPAEFGAITLPGGDQFKQRDIELPTDWQNELFPREGLFYTAEHPNGDLLGLYSFDGPKLDGAVAEFHDNGTLKSLATYRDGRRDGAFHVWDEDGNRVLYAQFVRDARQGFSCFFVDGAPRLLQRWAADQHSPNADEFLVTEHNRKPEGRPRRDLDADAKAELDYRNQELAALLERIRSDEMTVKQGLADWYREEVERIRRMRASRLSANAREQMLAIQAAGRAQMTGKHRQLLNGALRTARQQ